MDDQFSDRYNAPRMSSPVTVLQNVRRGSDSVDIQLSNGRIDSLRPAGSPVPAGARKIDGRGYTAVPGFIDLHIHGALGFDFMDASEEAYRKTG